jgi:hypothetical protein
MWHFHSFSLKRRISVYFFLLSKEQWKILNTLSGSSLIFALSIHTTFNQTQTDATVPLIFLGFFSQFLKRFMISPTVQKIDVGVDV